VFAAGALIGAIPVVVLFLALQRFIVSGLTSGAVKG
jgi:arabinogalactan oligomer/maltooligosaccharide transport system permease protein